MKSFSSLFVFLIILLFLSCKEVIVPDAISQEKRADSASFDKTYAHIVYFWFKDPSNAADRAFFEKSLRTFLDNSNYAKTNFIGTPPPAIREVVDDTFTYNLVVSFESAAAQQAYQNEQAHKTFIADCAHLWEKVIVYDANGIVEGF